MPHPWPSARPTAPAPTRRSMLWRLGGGLGGVALAHLLGQNGLLAADSGASYGTPPLPHRPPRVKRVIQLFMNGGVSQMDTFDHKPLLNQKHGQKFDPGAGQRVEAATSAVGNVLGCPFEFKQHGQCGRWVSGVFPHVAQCVDDIAFLMGMASKTNVHGPGS